MFVGWGIRCFIIRKTLRASTIDVGEAASVARPALRFQEVRPFCMAREAGPQTSDLRRTSRAIRSKRGPHPLRNSAGSRFEPPAGAH